MIYRESWFRSATKAVSWRVLGSFATAAVVYFFSRRFDLALLVGGVEAVAKIFLYIFHERLWAVIPFGKKAARPGVVWFTGLSGAGKTTVADRVADALTRKGFKVERLDGDVIREFFPETGFTREDRIAHVKRVAHLASRMEAHGIVSLVSLISPHAEARDFARKSCRNFFEVHVSTSLEVCEGRDVKGLYARARAGNLANFTGVSDPYEAPLRPELVLDCAQGTPEEAAQKVLKELADFL